MHVMNPGHRGRVVGERGTVHDHSGKAENVGSTTPADAPIVDEDGVHQLHATKAL
jgi:hypothetical protein